MTIEEYLQSEEAVRDVAAALERRRADTDDPARDRWIISDGGAWSFAFCMGAHEPTAEEAVYAQRPGEPQITYPTREAAHVYFRPEGDRFIVTDLGEAVRALRLRTGGPLIMPGAARNKLQCQIARLCGNNVLMDDWTLYAANDLYGGNPLDWFSITAADLPRAITRVLLAAHRVASLDASEEP